MNTRNAVVLGGLGVCLLLAACAQEEDRGTTPTAATPAAPAEPAPPPAPPAAALKMKQKDLTCRTGWEDFCGAWTMVTDIQWDRPTNPGKPEQHIRLYDRFVVGSKKSDPDQLLIFPRANLDDVWKLAPPKQLPLYPVEGQGGQIDRCLMAKVNLRHGPENAPVDEAHQFRLSVDEGTATPAVGVETRLLVALRRLESEDPWPPEACEFPSVPEAGNPDHGGFGHAEN